jgi:WD40 repeat protein
MWTAESAVSALCEAKPDGWDALLGDTGFLLHIDPDLLKSVVPLTYRPATDPASRLFEVYRTVARRMTGLDVAARAQVLAVQAIRFGARECLGPDLDTGIWSCGWTTGDTVPRGLLAQFPQRTTEKAALGSRNGGPVAVISDFEDGTLHVWDLVHGLPVSGPLVGHEAQQEGCLKALVTVAEGTVAVSSGYDHTLRCWDLTAHEQIGSELRVEGYDRARCLAETRIGGVPAVVLGGPETLEVRGLAPEWEPLSQPMPLPDRATAVAAFDLEGVPMAAVGCGDGSVTVWDLVRGQVVGAPLPGHLGRLTAITTVEIDGTTLILTAGVDGTLRIWDARDQALRACVTTDGPAHISSLAAIGRDEAVEVLVGWNAGDLVSRFDLPRGYRAKPGPVELRPTVATGSEVAVLELDGRRAVLVAGGWHPQGGLWEADLLTPPTAVGHRGGVNALAVAPVGGRLALVTAGEDGMVRTWDRVTGEPFGRPLTATTDRDATDLAVTSFGGRTLTATCDGQDEVRVWDLVTGHRLAVLDTDSQWVQAVGFTEIEGRTCVVATGGYRTQVWDLASTDERKTGLENVGGYFKDVATTYVDGLPVAVTAAPSGQVTVWDWTADETFSLSGHRLDVNEVTAAEIGGRSLVLTTASYGRRGEVRLWDLGYRECLWDGMAGHCVAAVALAGIGDRIVAFTGGEDGSVVVWDGASGQPFDSLYLPEAVRAMAWDGERLAIGYGSEIAVFEIRL